MEKFILEHKKISFFIGAAVAFYFFVAVPLEKIYENRKNIELKQKRLERIISNGHLSLDTVLLRVLSKPWLNSKSKTTYSIIILS